MKYVKNLSGILITVFFCGLTIPTALFWPVIQMRAIFDSTTIHHIVQQYIVDQNTFNKCNNELIWICTIYLTISLIISWVFYRLQAKKDIGVLLFVLFLIIQFYILQTPFFIGKVGTFYNCQIDRQTIMGTIVSSPMVSLTMIVFGIIYDLVNSVKREQASSQQS